MPCSTLLRWQPSASQSQSHEWTAVANMRPPCTFLPFPLLGLELMQDVLFLRSHLFDRYLNSLFIYFSCLILLVFVDITLSFLPEFQSVHNIYSALEFFVFRTVFSPSSPFSTCPPLGPVVSCLDMVGPSIGMKFQSHMPKIFSCHVYWARSHILKKFAPSTSRVWHKLLV